MAERIDVVLFDLGGVLIELGGVAPMKEFAGIDEDDELWRRWLSCRWVREFERGECGVEDFARGVVDDWGLTITPAALIESFAAWPIGPFPGAIELVLATRERARVGCLSNTNALHWGDRFRHWPLTQHFDHAFLSFELGVVKPDREMFDVVAHQLGVDAGQILFIDDNRINVDAARAAGWRSERAVGVAETDRALVAHRILTD